MTSTLELEAVTQRFRKVTALDDLSLRFEGGRIHGLLGRNGSGKTTLLTIAAAFRRPTAGRALLDGSPVFENPDATSRICLIRGSGDTVEHDWPEDRVKDALRFASTMWPAWDGRFADHLVERFDLDPGARLSELSRGQRSAVGVVLGLASRAPVTLLDESYLGMDAPSRYAFYEEVLTDYAEHPRTLVLSTHLIGEVSTLFDHVSIIDRGRLLVHEDAEPLRGRGIEVTGDIAAVDRFVADRELLSERTLGRTKAATVYGEVSDADRAAAAAAGLDLGPIALQDLFVHLTTRDTDRRSAALDEASTVDGVPEAAADLAAGPATPHDNHGGRS